MRLIFFIGILAVLGGHSITEGANFVTAGKDLLGSTLNIGKGVAKAIPSYLDPAQILDLGKQSILGYPVNLLAEAINSVCSAVQSTGYLRSGDKPEESNLAFRLFTPCKNYSYPIESADDMWTNPDFDKNKPVVLFATGWTTNINETDAMTILAKAHACRGDNNFIGVDDNNVDGSEKLQLWKEAAGGKSRGRCYGTVRMAVNIQYEVSYLTQVTISNLNSEAESQAIEMARADASRAREEAALANARADEANATAREAMAETAELKRKFEEFQKQLFAWQLGQADTSIVPSSVHPSVGDHYDDDSHGQSLDLEGMSDGC